MARGRADSRIVREYLEAVAMAKTKRRRAVSPDAIAQRLATLESEMASASAVKRLALVQQRLDLERRLAEASTDGVDIEALEDAFVGVAAGYSERKGISYRAWREIGVEASVLRRANIRDHS